MLYSHITFFKLEETSCLSQDPVIGKYITFLPNLMFLINFFYQNVYHCEHVFPLSFLSAVSVEELKIQV